jgi:hypothetical protein
MVQRGLTFGLLFVFLCAVFVTVTIWMFLPSEGPSGGFTVALSAEMPGNLLGSGMLSGTLQFPAASELQLPLEDAPVVLFFKDTATPRLGEASPDTVMAPPITGAFAPAAGLTI